MRAYEVSQCLGILSQYQLSELCQFIIGKLKSAKLSAEQFKLFQQTVVSKSLLFFFYFSLILKYNPIERI